MLTFCLDQQCDQDSECSEFTEFSGSNGTKSVVNEGGSEILNCAIFEFPYNAKEIIFHSNMPRAGFYQFQVTQIFNEKAKLASSTPINARILRAKWIYIMDQIIGWTYFVLWSVSFYPQVKQY